MTHLQTTRNPMSEARRQHIFGPLQSLADDAHAAGFTRFRIGAPLIIVLVPAIMAGAAAFLP